MKRVILFVLVLTTAVLITCKKKEVITTGDLQGVVKTTAGQPIEGVTVSLGSTNSKTTGTDGKYSFIGLEPKDYSVIASKQGYDTEPHTVTVVVGETKVDDFILDIITLTLNVTPSSYEAPAAQSTLSINVTSNISWTASSNQSWITLNPTTGSNNATIIASFQSNSTTIIRPAIVTITGSNLTQIVTINQLSSSPTVPVVSTGTVSNITENSITISGTVSNFGVGSTSVSQHGHCWSLTNPNPTITNCDDKTTNGALYQTGVFYSNISGLQAEKTYYICSYATNSTGTAYGTSITFTTKPYFSTNLVAFYPFNGNANDESGNNNNGSVTNATLTTDYNAISNSAYNFNGSNSKISVSGNLSGFSTFTLSCWVLIDGTVNYQETIIQTPNGYIDYNPSTNFIEINIFADRIGCANTGTRYYYAIGLTNVENVWKQITFVGLSDNTAKLYIDGISIGVGGRTTDNGVGGNFNHTIFGCNNSSTSYGQWFKGKLDEIRVYNRELNSSEIQQIYNHNK